MKYVITHYVNAISSRLFFIYGEVMANLKSKFGKRVKEIRKSKGYTQEQIAEIIGIEPPNISKLEKGVHFPNPDNIEKLANALNSDIKDLFDFGHFEDKSTIKTKLKNYIDEANDKEIEFVYKFIVALDLYKKN